MAGFRRVALLIGVMAIATIVQAAPEDVAGKKLSFSALSMS